MGGLREATISPSTRIRSRHKTVKNHSPEPSVIEELSIFQVHSVSRSTIEFFRNDKYSPRVFDSAHFHAVH